LYYNFSPTMIYNWVHENASTLKGVLGMFIALPSVLDFIEGWGKVLYFVLGTLLIIISLIEKIRKWIRKQ